MGLPLTTISIVDPAQQTKLDSNVDALHIHDHMPDPNILFGNEATKHLAALVRYWMQNYLLKTQWQHSMVACENDFNLGRTKFERVVSGKKRGGGHKYGKKRKLRPDEQPTGAMKPRKKRENPVDKGQVKTGIGCKYCDNVCLNEETLSIHINNKHADRQPMFQCEELEEHSKEKHGGLQPGEQELQTQRCREEKLEQSERRKEKAEEEAKQTKYFPCKECVEGFNTKRELDTHMTDKHIFICSECLRTFKIKAERDTHMKKNHKGVSTKMTKQEKLLAEEWRKRESREEKDRWTTETWKKVWSKYAAKKEQQAAEEKKKKKRKPLATQTKEEAERAEGDDRDEDKDYVPLEEPSSEDPPYEPTKKELRRADKEGDQWIVFYVFSLADQKLTQYMYILIFVDFNLFSYSTHRLFFSTIERSY